MMWLEGGLFDIESLAFGLIFFDLIYLAAAVWSGKFVQFL